MTDTVKIPQIFSRSRRRLVRDRAFARTQGASMLEQLMADEILERLALVKRDFSRCLIIGLPSMLLKEKLRAQDIAVCVADSSHRLSTFHGGVQCDEDRLPFADHSFDLILNLGSLDTVNDLPGALLLARRILIPDGLFLACFCGAESLSILRSVILEAEGDRVAPHIHPQIDVRTAGDLMARAALALPVADGDTLYLRYTDLAGLLRDVRDLGGSNILEGRVKPISRSIYRKIHRKFQERADQDGKVTETVELIYLSGWAPHANQPKPARRGSGQVSLKTALSGNQDN
ncbi:methyltransferase domain-containing protein [Parasphingorhabdus sp.]|uniref:methyltransferase domain-containing protein n=1 Tax=Parasphingorhabdus sp. TaxID=2709688 RepID=UPI003D2E4AA9